MPEGLSTPGDLVQSVAGFIDGRLSLPPGAAVVVAVSGGADSLALLAVLRELAAEPARGYRLTVAHLDHGLRPDSADDARFVADLARDWGLPCVVERQDVADLAAQKGVGVEQAARDARYEFLARVARQAGATRVAVGHNADDHVETVLFRIVRGTHLRGLGGIPVERILFHEGATLVRPLLATPRERIEQYCRDLGLVWRTDTTNADTSYRRNFIRQELLPLLRQRLNPRVDEAIRRLAQAAREADAYLVGRAGPAVRAVTRPESVGCPAYCFEAAPLRQLDELLQRYALRLIYDVLGLPQADLTAERLRDLRSLLDQEAMPAQTLAGGWQARRECDVLVFCPPGCAPPEPTGHTAILDCPGLTHLSDGRQITCTIEPYDAEAFSAHCREHPPGVELLDAEKVEGMLLCRPRWPGATFRPLGAPGDQSVSDFLTNAKVPQAQRGRVLCICDEAGIVYLVPLRIDDRLRVTERTRRVLRVEVAPPWGP